ncbi:MAG: DnaA regulatory inactivator Hda [Gammaproteobacteria bacterium]|nr:DnaA regulatory inactivator Hda [Gammaproteobacteria bacterium]
MQLPLSMRLPDNASFENFVPGPNQAVVAAVSEPRGDVLLIGGPGSGKSHLLQAALRQWQARDRDVAYAPLDDVDGALLAAYVDADLLAVDELERLRPEHSLALLRVLDTRRAAARITVIASRDRPANLDAIPPDLKTRLTQAEVYPLAPLDDAARQQLLIQRAQGRGLSLPPEVAHWLLTQLPRDSGSLIKVLDELDLASLQAQRRLTIPFVRQALRDVRPHST